MKEGITKDSDMPLNDSTQILKLYKDRFNMKIIRQWKQAVISNIRFGWLNRRFM